MTNVHRIEDIASTQHGVLAYWQLIAAGWSADRAARALRGLRRLHDGVAVTGAGPVTDIQRWWAATLTAPGSVLSRFSAGACWEMRWLETGMTAVTRVGRGGPRQYGTLRVHYSVDVAAHTVRRHGLLVTSPERTIIDLWPALEGNAPSRLLREGMRLRRTDAPKLLAALDLHSGRRGVATLRDTVAVYARLPLDRCRSDAEVEGLLVLDAAGVALPRVNERHEGEEADFSWPDRRLIIEIDGSAFHQDPLEDARKTRIWTLAGWQVRRTPAAAVYADPAHLVALARG